MRTVLLLALTACGTPEPDSVPQPTDTGAASTGAPGAPTTPGTPGGTTTDTATSSTGITFTAHRIGSPEGPAFTTIADVDGDGQLDIVLSRFGSVGLSVPNGAVELWSRDGALDSWSMTEIVPPSEDVEFPNHTTVQDIDGDGDLDVFVPSGFLVCAAVPWEGPCGGLAWFEQTPTGWVRHTLFDGQASFAHTAALEDIDGDGLLDVLTVVEQINAFGPDSAIPEWYRGTGSGDFFETAPQDMGVTGLGSFPSFFDVDGDGDQDLVSAEFAMEGGSFAWLERTADPSIGTPGGSWTRHVIADDVGPSIQLAMVHDLYGDGAWLAIGANHTNTASANPDPWESAVYAFELPADPTQAWPRHKLSTGVVSVPGSAAAPQAAPGIFGVGDIDGDGDLDIALAGDGDPRVFWLEQLSVGQWATHTLHPDLPQAGGMSIADLDGDGDNEIVVTGYEDNALFVLERN